MAKRKPARGGRKAGAGRKTAAAKTRKRAAGTAKSAGRSKARKTGSSATGGRKAAAPRAGARKTTKPFGPPPRAGQGTRTKTSRIDRERRRLEETVPTPPSSLNMNRRGSAARTGRAELAETRDEHHGMNTVTAGDVDVDAENAYFSGDEAPGGDNPTPDQDIVDDIGKALGVEYQDNEELQAADKVTARDKHRWELDPASSEDYKERK
jgi:hypothetical protein